MSYRIKRGILGAQVLYQCPNCQGSLTGKLDDAGSQDQCPLCNTSHVVPGMQEKQQQERQKQVDRERRAQGARQLRPPGEVTAVAPVPRQLSQPPIPQRALPPSVQEEDAADRFFNFAIAVSRIVLHAVGLIGTAAIAIFLVVTVALLGQAAVNGEDITGVLFGTGLMFVMALLAYIALLWGIATSALLFQIERNTRMLRFLQR